MPLYDPLPEGSVRLLRILPRSNGHQGIECQLFTCPLLNSASTHPYEALSYAWGPENNQKSIRINNCQVSVRTNLHAALSCLQDGFIERIMWVDAICINQDDSKEKGQQVQSMAKIFARASRVIVWLGEVADQSNEALEAIRAAAAQEQSAVSATDKAIIALLDRPWFKRIWVLQEVAAARHILIKSGRTEIDGYAFCSGLSALNISYETIQNLRDIIPPIAYLIRGAVFRPRYGGCETSQPGRFSLNIRPLSELVDMYHTRKATEPLDKIYALLGMSSDDPNDLNQAGLLPNYQMSWNEVFRNLVKFSICDQISVHTWDDNEVAVIKAKGCVLGKVSAVERYITRGDTQSVDISWKRNFCPEGNQISRITFPASAKLIQVGDAVCFLQGSSKPSIVRSYDSYLAVIMIAVPSLELTQSVTAFPNDMLLVWDWDTSQVKSQGEGYCESLLGSWEKSRCPRPECRCQDYLDEATTLWDFGLSLNGMERYREAEKNLRKAVGAYGIALRSAKMNQCLWAKANNAALTIMDGLLVNEKDAGAESLNRYSRIPLSQAAESGNAAFARLLIEKGADIDCKDGRSRTPLLWAAANGHEAIVRLLLEKGAEIDCKDKRFRTPLFWAAKKGHEATARLLLENGADINSTYMGTKPLFLAAANGYEAMVRRLFEKGADINCKDEGSMTALSWAAANGYEAMVRLLLEKGADINCKDERSMMPLSWAAANGHEAIVQLLIEKGVEIDCKDGTSMKPLSWAAANGHEAIVQLLIEKGAEMDYKDYGSRVPLSWAAANGHEATVQLLIKKGANIDCKDESSRTPLSWAAANGHEVIVRLLIEKGADINCNYMGFTPVFCAAKCGHEAIVRLLLMKGAVVDGKNEGIYLTPSSQAAVEGHGIVRLLRDRGARVELVDVVGDPVRQD